ncbi:conserved hypothetical protein [Candida dubliniensis CD36]|uniref:Uncharacterized protein n=1 Tax=Candida dubliniensis (strain CD36 / ATCC MYA-646 / CBS 7987 / NCPF 3949 / NRRL Y-17841) TaxID=573826 RepID=B9WD76_CANDC|nr:conserved hypothetical protein [Candida dubliniensis CD36]CAX42626.1 conserved hypothetical protein [Candida dubliniensis CD36]
MCKKIIQTLHVYSINKTSITMNLFSKLENHQSNEDHPSLILFPDFLPEMLSFTTAENERIQDLYLQLCSLFNHHNYNEILFLLPQVSSFSMLPPIINLIIGATMIRMGRLDSGFRELAVAIIMSSRGEQRIGFLIVAATLHAELNDKERVQGYLGEILDLSRQVVQSSEEFDIVKENLEELENTLLVKLENIKDKE